MLERFQDYIETSDWERHGEDDKPALTIFCWMAIIFSIVWFGPTILRIMIYGPVQ